MQRLAREYTPRGTEILREIADDPNEDTRNRIVAIGMLLERAWGKPKEYDPATEQQKAAFNPRDYTPEELDQIEAALRLIVLRQTATSRPGARRYRLDAGND